MYIYGADLLFDGRHLKFLDCPDTLEGKSKLTSECLKMENHCWRKTLILVLLFITLQRQTYIFPAGLKCLGVIQGFLLLPQYPAFQSLSCSCFLVSQEEVCSTSPFKLISPPPTLLSYLYTHTWWCGGYMGAEKEGQVPDFSKLLEKLCLVHRKG